MSYSNYGEIGDVWKHLPLLEVLSIEKPDYYFETNAAYAKYQVETATEKQRFGVGTILSAKGNEKDFPFISTSYFIENLPGNIDSTFTLYGSPALAHKILGNDTNYIFCDLDKEALKSQKDYFLLQSSDVELINEDSIEYTWNWLNNPNLNTFMVIDPYEINEPNTNGHTFFEVFKKSAERGVRTFLWYHFQSAKMNEWVQNLVNSLDREDLNLSNHFFAIDRLGVDGTPDHPGVPGCGILTANLRSESIKIIDNYAIELDKLYTNVPYKNHLLNFNLVR